MNIFIGCEHSAKLDWEKHIGQPKKNANWKQETYEAKLPELIAKQEAKAPEHLAAGCVSQAAVLTQDGKAISYCAYNGLQLLDALQSVGNNGATYTVYGFDVLAALRQCGWYAHNAATSVRAPSWVWNAIPNNNVNIVNLFSCSGAKNTDISLEQMIEYWVPDLEANAKQVLPSAPTCAADLLAAAAYTIAHAMGVVQ